MAVRVSGGAVWQAISMTEKHHHITGDELLALITRAHARRHARGPWYGTTRYRRDPDLRPSHMSRYAHHWHWQQHKQRDTELFERILGPGTLWGDLFDVAQGDEAAASRLAHGLHGRWRITYDRHRQEYEELHRLAREEEKSAHFVKLQLLQRAVMLVTQYMHWEVLVRSKERDLHAVDGAKGRRVPCVPGEKSLLEYWEWVQQEVPKAAKADLLGREYRPDAAYQRLCNVLNRDVATIADVEEFSAHDEANRDAERERLKESHAELRALAMLSEAQERAHDLDLAGLSNEESGRTFDPPKTREQVKQLLYEARKKLAAAAGVAA